MGRSLVAALVLLVGALASGCASIPRSDPHPLAHHAFPKQQGASLDGGEITIPSTGRVTLIDVWSTACKPCMKLMPKIDAIWEKYRARGLDVVGVAVDDNPGLVVERLRELHVRYPNIVDASGNIRAALRSADLPQTFVIDRAGQVRVVRVGGDDDDAVAIEAAAEKLLGE